MKTLHFLLFIVALGSTLVLSGCADVAKQNPNSQTNAALAPTPSPQDFRNAQPGMRGGY
jgi:outer membrane murein-binding lipoprotein Lpp